jgi:iron complex outermembrane receptor protein
VKYFITILIIVNSLGDFFSQIVDTSKHLQTFEKRTSNFLINKDFLKSNKKLPLTQERSNESIDQILEGETINYLKHYGPGTLSSISTRGGNAQQTSLIYNDFVLNNPLNGMVDFSTIPSVFFNSVSVLYGISSSNLANGALAGAVVLEDNQDGRSFIESGSVQGSYQQNSNFLKINYNKRKLQTSINIFRKSALNNYSYLDLNDDKKTQENASLNHLALMSSTKISLGKSEFKIIYFGQIIEREIPSGFLESPSSAFQNDVNHRIFSSLKHRFLNSYVQFKSAYYDEKNIYTDSIRSVFGNNPCKTFINQIDFSKSINNFNILKINLTNSLASSNGNNYLGKAEINRTSITGSYKLNNPKYRLKHLITSSVLFDDKNLSPLTFSYSLKREFYNNFNLYFNAGKVYRFPTINDLFWSPGGNLDLLPEKGYTSDIGVIWNKNIHKVSLSFEPSLYSRWIDNWILWQPNGSFWSPMNVKKVWNRGIETSSKFHFKNKKIIYEFTLKTAYNMSTNINVYDANNNSLDKQLIYTPHYKLVFKSQINYKDFTLTYLHNYTGYRFTSRDNESFLPSFNLGRLFLSFRLKLKNNSAKIFYKINNLYNTNYQVVLNRPMPLINHEIGINFKINK